MKRKEETPEIALHALSTQHVPWPVNADAGSTLALRSKFAFVGIILHVKLIAVHISVDTRGFKCSAV
jgi:hypothetical protein